MNRKYSILATALLISMGAFAQKDEFKTLKKIYEKDKISTKDVMNYKAAVATATPLVSSSNEEDTVYLNFYASTVPFIEMTEAMAKPENQSNPQNALKYFTPAKIVEFAENTNAVLMYEKKSGKSVLTKKIQELVTRYKPTLLSYAVSLGDQKRFSDASSVLYGIYLLDPTDTEKLYYAASYAVNANDYKSALEHYKILKDLDYSGERTNYLAVNKVNDNVDYFGSKADRDQSVKLGTHEKPTEEKEPSKRGEIYKNIALILASEGKTEQAKAAIVDARKANPDDTSLIISEADIYLKTNDMATYAKLIKEVLEKEPNNADLYYNLGVVSGQNKDNKNAETYYTKAIALKPEYANAYYNLAAIRIDDAQLVLDQMNKLGTSAAENKKYDVLKTQRETILKDVVQLLEKTTSLDKKNKDAKEVLLSVYKALEMKEKAKALQIELDK
ncbi:tetratricopeptide repeat protein [Flavobacterium antarcticum]|uniref:tetratricopeptide repeat protein n=1 Tax=Flavobacterium antarcticum TaxID=271155 RepID=UPI0003B5710A|nr:tetratricopeptide repeat protein [Flavobacterium antarcticum]